MGGEEKRGERGDERRGEERREEQHGSSKKVRGIGDVTGILRLSTYR